MNEQQRETLTREDREHRRGLIAQLKEAGCSDYHRGFSVGTMEAALNTIDDLVADNERLRVKLQEQENIIALQGQTVPQVHTFTTTAFAPSEPSGSFRIYPPARCENCGRTLAELPNGYILISMGTYDGSPPTYRCTQPCTPASKARQAASNRKGATPDPQEGGKPDAV